MKKILLLVIFLLLALVSYSQIVKVVPYGMEYDVKVYLTTNKIEADAVIWKCKNVSRSQHNVGYWYFVSKWEGYHYGKVVNVLIVEDWNEADIKVTFTPYPSRVVYNDKYLRHFVK